MNAKYCLVPCTRYLAALSSIAVMMLAFIGCEQQRSPETWLFPNGYLGWIRLVWSVRGAPSLPIINGHRVVSTPEDGLLETSSDYQVGAAVDEYCYVAGMRRKVSIPQRIG